MVQDGFDIWLMYISVIHKFPPPVHLRLEIDVNNRRLYSLIHYNALVSLNISFCSVASYPRTAHIVPELFKAIIVFNDRATIYSDVISLTADQLKPTPGNLWIRGRFMNVKWKGAIYWLLWSRGFLFKIKRNCDTFLKVKFTLEHIYIHIRSRFFINDVCVYASICSMHLCYRLG